VKEKYIVAGVLVSALLFGAASLVDYSSALLGYSLAGERK
jgi:hypothetical protein